MDSFIQTKFEHQMEQMLLTMSFSGKSFVFGRFYPYLSKKFILENLYIPESYEHLPYREDFSFTEMKKVWLIAEKIRPFNIKEFSRRISTFSTEHEIEEYIYRECYDIFYYHIKYFLLNFKIVFAQLYGYTLLIQFKIKDKLIEIDTAKFEPPIRYHGLFVTIIDDFLRANPYINADFYIRTIFNPPLKYLNEVISQRQSRHIINYALTKYFSPELIQKIQTTDTDLLINLTLHASYAPQFAESCFNNSIIRTGIRELLTQFDIHNLKQLRGKYNTRWAFPGIYAMARFYPRKGWFQDTDINEIDESLPLLSQSYTETLEFWNLLGETDYDLSLHESFFNTKKRLLSRMYHPQYLIKHLLELQF